MLNKARRVLPTLILLVACSSATLRDKLSDDQVRALAREVLRHTPEHTHFAQGTRFDWVFFTPGDEVAYPEAIPAIRDALASKYQVYSGDEKLPPGAEGHDGVSTSYVGGFLFSVSIRRVDEKTIEVEYSDYEGSLAAGRQTVRYQWRGSHWAKTWESPQVVS